MLRYSYLCDSVHFVSNIQNDNFVYFVCTVDMKNKGGHCGSSIEKNHLWNDTSPTRYSFRRIAILFDLGHLAVLCE